MVPQAIGRGRDRDHEIALCFGFLFEKNSMVYEFKKSFDSIVQKTMTVHYFCGQLILKVITSEGIFNLSLNFSTLDLPPNSLHFFCVKQGMYISVSSVVEIDGGS